MYPMVSPSMRLVKSGAWKRARVIVNSTSLDPRRKVTVTCEPSGPFTRLATSSVVIFVTSSPLTRMILSPFFTPARSAGVPGYTSITSIGTFGSGWKICTPIPVTAAGRWLKPLARFGSR